MQMSSTSKTTTLPSQKLNWIKEQELLRRKVVLEDDFAWNLEVQRGGVEGRTLKYVGGVDISFCKDDPNMACGALVVVDLEDGLKVVHEDFALARLQVPYIAGFLAFREAPILLGLLDRMKQHDHPFYPQVLLVDGNGVLHPRGFGLACYLGVVADIPTIGIGKNLHHVDGLTHSGVKEFFEANGSKTLMTLVGKSGRLWGSAIRSVHGSSKPIFISSGHRVSLSTATKVVEMCCRYRVPEPIRQADIRSRSYLTKHRH